MGGQSIWVALFCRRRFHLFRGVCGKGGSKVFELSCLVVANALELAVDARLDLEIDVSRSCRITLLPISIMLALQKRSLCTSGLLCRESTTLWLNLTGVSLVANQLWFAVGSRETEHTH